MLDRIRKLSGTRARRCSATVLVIAALALMAWAVRGWGRSDAAGLSQSRVFIDATTGKPFKHRLSAGETMPVIAPSGSKSGFPAESCYWTRDGKLKREPTYVLLNDHRQPAEKGATFCPDCGRLVVPLNPPGYPGAKPPRTRAEYESQR